MGELIPLLDLIAPFFGLIALGLLAGRLRPLPEAGLAGLQFFLVYVALPPLFYRLIADKPIEELADGRFMLGTTLCTLVAFGLAFATGMIATRRDVPQSVMGGLAGAYSNIGYMGPPLVLSALGASASAPIALILVCDTILLFTLVPLLMTLAGGRGQRLWPALGAVVRGVATHPFNIAVLIGLIASATRLRLPGPVDQIVVWLSGAAAPCALFLLGCTVAMRPLGRVQAEVPLLVAIKLLAHPLLAWVLLSALGDFSATWTSAAILMAALPPALNIFVLSAQYEVGVERASACILIGTLASVVTLTATLYLIGGGRLPHDLFPPG